MDSKKIKESFKNKYGVDHPSQVKEISDRIKKTILDNFKKNRIELLNRKIQELKDKKDILKTQTKNIDIKILKFKSEILKLKYP